MTIAAVLANQRQWHVETCDVLEGLRMLPAECVQCCVTSPPYWGLRDYSVSHSVWGGDPACVHDWQHANGTTRRGPRSDGTETPGSSDSAVGRGPRAGTPKSAFCKCGAWRGCYGMEPTPALFVSNTVAIFREVWRVLREDGTLWLNLGDSWNAYNGGSGPGGWNDARDSERPQLETGYGLRDKSLKPKDLCGIPWRVALALQADGWFLRQDIIWAKPNGMPESVRDRCTKSHEYIFLLTKCERYFYDRMAIVEPLAVASVARLGQDVEGQEGSERANGGGKTNGKMKAVKFGGNKLTESGQTRLASGNEWDPLSGANKRSVWTIPVGGFREAHFATFPLSLPETCLKAGTSAIGCCSKCGAPWERLTESVRVPTRPGDGSKVHGANSRANKSRDPAHASEYNGKKSVVNAVHHASEVGNRDPQRHTTATKTAGWQPTCHCAAANPESRPLPCLCLDPFSGAGTTGLVAKALGLRYIGLELNPGYAEMSRRRIDRGIVEDAPKQPKSLPGQADLFAGMETPA